MNIDLRNISLEFETEVNRIKKEFDISTNSKAVEHSVINYFKKLEEIKTLKEELFKTKQSLSHYERRLDNLKDLFGWIMEK
ncbi:MULTISPECIES: hypothetical protein [unclassified Flavobacterium]|jgi:hypothetical protein|uniref:hypothetical protein n=1 Tax=unclassified Flavobacterium TaxID=196869 RepID=UPI00064ACFCB|nr:hypothetical protein [Flavobacterium sp. ABG]KLT70356.1 hypothetical protein AB674_06685 [Flavobacterium sp. ABG]